MSEQFIYGMHAVSALLDNPLQIIHEAYILEGRKDERMQTILAQLERQGVSVHPTSRRQLDQWVEGANHQGIIVKASLMEYTEGDLPRLLENEKINFILVLDEVQDPHNLGACLRTADAAGVQLVLAPKRNAAPLSATVRKIACGAAETVPYIQVTNLARCLRLLQENRFWLYGLADQASKSIYQADLSGKLAMVLGAEGTGLRQLTRTHCDELLSIPQSGSVSSLNVSVATGVCLFEVVRQRSLK